MTSKHQIRKTLASCPVCFSSEKSPYRMLSIAWICSYLPSLDLSQLDLSIIAMAANDPSLVALNQSIDRIYEELQRILSNSTMSVQEKNNLLNLFNRENENLRRSTARLLTYEHAKMKTNHDLIQTIQHKNDREARVARQQVRQSNEQARGNTVLMCLGAGTMLTIGLIMLYRLKPHLS